MARADAPANVGETLARLEVDLRRAAPDAPARALAGRALREAEKGLADAREQLARGHAEEARANLGLLELRVRLVALSVDSGRLQAMAREREQRALSVGEEARVARAAFEQAVERRLELEQAPAPYEEEPAHPTATPAPPPPSSAAPAPGED
jgi:hypothetical protein